MSVESTELRTIELNGRMVGFTNQSVFEVQVGRWKSAYKTRYTFTGDLWRATRYFNCINIGRGYKKRIICRSFNKPVIARAFS
jgi:hypothetical protein